MADDSLWNSVISGEGDLDKRSIEDMKLEPLLDEINLIKDDGIRAFVRAMLLEADTFWEIPEMYGGQAYPPDEQGIGGAVLHTKRVVRIIRFLADAQERSDFEVDQMIAAALIHNITIGAKIEDGTYVWDPLHPVTIDRICDFAMLKSSREGDDQGSTTLEVSPEVLHAIMRMARCQLGKWSPIPELIPITIAEMTLHWSVLIAKNLHLITDKEPLLERWLCSPLP